MRNQEQHKKYCEYIDQPGISAAERVHYSKVYGINRKSILCELSNFNVTEQLPQDLMHVLFEGVFQAHIRELLKYLVEGLSVVTLVDVNSRIMSYPYAYFEEKPGPLTSFDPHGNQSGIHNIIIRILYNNTDFSKLCKLF